MYVPTLVSFKLPKKATTYYNKISSLSPSFQGIWNSGNRIPSLKGTWNHKNILAYETWDHFLLIRNVANSYVILFNTLCVTTGTWTNWTNHKNFLLLEGNFLSSNQNVIIILVFLWWVIYLLCCESSCTTGRSKGRTSKPVVYIIWPIIIYN